MKSFSCFKPRDPFRNWSKELDKRVAVWAENFNSSFKLLLLGPAGAGKTTILKQMKIIHFEGFSLEERQQKAKEIRSNLLESVRELTACITASGHQINWCDKENQLRLDFINGLNLDDQTYDLYAAKIYDFSKRILTDKAVEELFAQLNQLSITHRSQYLLNRVDEIRNVNYIPNNDDILQSRRKTSDIQKLEFEVKLPVKSRPSIKQTFCMFDVGGQRGERRKWIQVFDGVSAVMFLIDSSSFDAIDDENGRNKLKETINLFYEVWTTRFLLNSNFVLLFNKQDILREKIKRGHKIEDHFPEYKQYKCQPQDRALLSRAGDKLNLFRSSSRSSSSTTTTTSNATITAAAAASRSQSSSTGGGGGTRSVISGNLSANTISPTDGVAKKSTTTTTGSLREKRKSSLYRFRSSKRSADITNTCTGDRGGGNCSADAAISRENNNNTTTIKPEQQQQQPASLASSTTSVPLPVQVPAPAPPSPNPNNPGSPKPHQQQQQLQQQLQQLQSTEQAYIRARSFIRDKFLQVTRQCDNQDNLQRKFSSPNIMSYNSKGCVDQPKRTVCYHYTTATDTENIRDLFENLQKMVIKSTLKDMRV